MTWRPRKTKLYERGHLVNIGRPADPYVEQVHGTYGPYAYRIRAVAEAIRQSGADYFVLPLVDQSTRADRHSWHRELPLFLSCDPNERHFELTYL